MIRLLAWITEIVILSTLTAAATAAIIIAINPAFALLLLAALQSVLP